MRSHVAWSGKKKERGDERVLDIPRKEIEKKDTSKCVREISKERGSFAASNETGIG